MIYKSRLLVMKNAPYHTVFVFIAFLVLSSCSKDDDAGCSGAWGTELQNEITALSTAIGIYYEDETEANCDDLKDAYQDYINALKPYGNCATLTGANRAAWQDAINEAEADLDTICD